MRVLLLKQSTYMYSIQKSKPELRVQSEVNVQSHRRNVEASAVSERLDQLLNEVDLDVK